MPKDQEHRLILLAEITGAHGTRGDVVLRTYTAEPGSLSSYGPLSDANRSRAFSLSVVRVTNKGTVVHIEGINDRTHAEALRGSKLYVARERLPATNENEFYHADLVGLRAVAPDGTELGEIVAAHNFGGGDLLELKPASGKATEYIPFRDEWVPMIDIASGTITINVPASTDDERNSDS